MPWRRAMTARVAGAQPPLAEAAPPIGDEPKAERRPLLPLPLRPRPDTPAAPWAEEGRTGIALIDREACTAYRGLPCRVCFDLCPVPGVLQMTRGPVTWVPIAGPAACTGCGVCVEHCRAGAVRVVAPDEAGGGRVRISEPPDKAASG